MVENGFEVCLGHSFDYNLGSEVSDHPKSGDDQTDPLNDERSWVGLDVEAHDEGDCDCYVE